MQAALNYIRNGYYKEALHALNDIPAGQRGARWYFFSAVANQGPVIMWRHRSMHSRRCPWNRVIWSTGSFCRICSLVVPGIRIWVYLSETGIGIVTDVCHLVWIYDVFELLLFSAILRLWLWNSDQWRNVNFYKRNRDILSPQLAIAFGEKISRFLSTQRFKWNVHMRLKKFIATINRIVQKKDLLEIPTDLLK